MKSHRLGALWLAAAVAACGESASSPVGAPAGSPGSLALVLDAPDDRSGALLLAIRGGPVDSVVAAGSAEVSAGAATLAGATQIFVAGTLTTGATVARVYVPDAGAVASYRAEVLQAADRVTFARLPVSAYRVTVSAP